MYKTFLMELSAHEKREDNMPNFRYISKKIVYKNTFCHEIVVRHNQGL